MMNIERTQTGSENTAQLAGELSRLHGNCIGCTKCDGLCAALIDALMVPNVVLSAKSGVN